MVFDLKLEARAVACDEHAADDGALDPDLAVLADSDAARLGLGFVVGVPLDHVCLLGVRD